MRRAPCRPTSSIRSRRRIRQGGFGYLKRRAAAFNNAAKGGPFILLTDLDQHVCPSELRHGVVGRTAQAQELVFRVAVREVESWLLGDMIRLRSFLHLKNVRAVTEPEALLDPKQELLKLSLGSRVRRMRRQ